MQVLILLSAFTVCLLIQQLKYKYALTEYQVALIIIVFFLTLALLFKMFLNTLEFHFLKGVGF